MIVSRQRPILNSPQQVYEYLKKIFAKLDRIDRDKEHFYVIILTARNQVKLTELVSLGTANASLVHPREVFRRAIHLGAISIIVAHNHPSGDPEPSAADLEVTRRLTEAGKLIGIEVLDHVIVGKNTFYSAAKNYR